MPLMFERSYIPAQLFQGLSIADLKCKPMYDLFAEDYQETIRLAEEEFYASIALDYEADLWESKKEILSYILFVKLITIKIF